MNHLTNYYKNRCSQLQEQVNTLKNRLSYIIERQGPQMDDVGPAMGGGGFGVAGPADLAPGAMPNVMVSGQMDTGPVGGFGGPSVPGSQFGTPEFAGNPGSFGPGGGGQFSGAQLGALIGAGDMDAVYQYLSQFYGNNPQALAAILASLGLNAPSSAGDSVESAARRVMTAAGPAGDSDGSGMGGGAAPYSGAQLGNLLGQVTPQNPSMQNVQNYLNQYGPNGQYVAGPANVSTQSPFNKARGARRGAGRSATGR